MARMPGVAFIGPTPNRYPGGMVEVRGLVEHIQQGPEAGSIAWFENPAAKASAHFLNPKQGPLVQLVDTADAAWAEVAGNRYWVSVENEGYSGDSLTPSQISNNGQLLAWLHTTEGVPLVATDDPNGKGLGWHGMGGVSWGNHPDCPGLPIRNQRGAIIAAAQHFLGSGPATVSLAHIVAAARRDPSLPQGGTTYRAEVLIVERALAAEHLLDWHWVDGSFGTMTVNAYASWQRQDGVGGPYDGIPGIQSLTDLGARHGFDVTA